MTNLVRSVVRPGTTVEWRGYNGLSKAGYKHEKVNHSLNQKVNAILWKAYRMPSRKNYGLLLAEYCWRRSVLGGPDLAPQTMAESSFLAFVGDHEGGSSARLPGQASFLQARGRMARFKGLLLLKHSQKRESGFRD